MIFHAVAFLIRFLSLGMVDLIRGYECEMCGIEFDLDEPQAAINHMKNIHGMKVDKHGNVYFDESPWESGEAKPDV